MIIFIIVNYDESLDNELKLYYFIYILIMVKCDFIIIMIFEIIS